MKRKNPCKIVINEKSVFYNNKPNPKPTHFVQRILVLYGCPRCHVSKADCPNICNSVRVSPKIISLHQSYAWWKKRFDTLFKENGVISLCYGVNIEFLRLRVEDGIGIQKLIFEDGSLLKPMVDGKYISIKDLSKHFGLRWEDFKEWCDRYDLTQPLAIIHYTGFRY